MRQLPIIFEREYVERVRSRSFLISTLLTPLIISVFAVGPSLTEKLQSSGSYRFFVVDETEQAGPRVVETLNSRRGSSDQVTADGGLAPTAGMRQELAGRVKEGSIDGYVWIPADVAVSDHAELFVVGEVPAPVRDRVSGAVSSAVEISRLRAAGVAERDLARIFRPVDVSVELVADEAGARVVGEGGMVLAILTGLLLYMLILLYGSQVMHSVQEEKTSRIAEVLVSSVDPTDLMLGKVLGVGAAALTQVAIWMVLAGGAFGMRARLTALGLPSDTLATIGTNLGPGIVLSSLCYLVLGFFLYATLFAAVGAAAASTEDAQRFTFPVILPLFIPIFLAEAIVGSPRGTMAVVLSWIPLTSPLVVPMRIGAGGAGGTEIAATLALLAASVAAVGWIAGKIYRVGILSTGSRPSLRELVRWLRMA
jgi:ABC-2 type transport system permease protein